MLFFGCCAVDPMSRMVTKNNLINGTFTFPTTQKDANRMKFTFSTDNFLTSSCFGQEIMVF